MRYPRLQGQLSKALPICDNNQREIDDFNNSIGELTGYDCRLCRNKGAIAVKGADGRIAIQRCSCLEVRRSVQLMQSSGIKENHSFSDFIVTEQWQQKMVDAAKKFADDTKGNWFFTGGQVGCGKTMLCTAIINELLQRCIPCRYMLWRDDVVRIKASVNDAEEYKDLIEPLKRTQVLYIDDFFKTEKGKYPTAADVNVAFEIINYRYNNTKLITIISSERSVNDLIDIDEAVGSRIYQRTKNYNVCVGEDSKKNYRLK